MNNVRWTDNVTISQEKQDDVISIETMEVDLATNSGIRWGLALFSLCSQGKGLWTMFEGDVRWQHAGIQISVWT